MKFISARARGCFLAFGCIVLPAAPLIAAATVDPGILASSGDVTVRIDDLRPVLDSLDARQQTALARDPALLKNAISTLLAQRIALKEALAKKWDQQPAVAAQIEQAREKAILESYLLSVSNPPENFPSPAELQSAYEANKAALLVPRQFRLAQIFIASPKDADATATAKARDKLDALQKSLRQPGADFAAIAHAGSDDKPGAENGGEIGWVAENQIQPEIRLQLLSLTRNMVSDPFQLADGWHILKLLDVREARTASLDEVRGQLAQQLRTQRAQANSQAYLAELLKRNPLTINDSAISQALNKGNQQP